jgi:hypothetical protein
LQAETLISLDCVKEGSRNLGKPGTPVVHAYIGGSSHHIHL